MLSLLTVMSLCVTLADAPADDGRWVHPLCQPLAVDTNGPFAALADGTLATVSVKGFRTSKDDGKTWSEPVPVCKDIHPREPASFYLLQTKSGALVIVYLNASTQKFAWNDATGEPKEGCCLEIWAIRSLDGGKTWIDQQRILDGYNANFFGFIQTPTGRLVTAVEHLVTNPGRHVVCSLLSDDDGKTWRRSNLIDLGGRGHHDGAMEPTVAMLGDGRLLMLIRTNLDYFWQAFSTDDGRYWRILEPSKLDASSSPGYLLRLQSGRLALIWNRLQAEGGKISKGKPGVAHEVGTSWYRQELSVAFSEDDAKTWTRPVVVARQKTGQISYPYFFERRPGELWMVAGFAHKKSWKEPAAPLRLVVKEEELLRESKASKTP